MWNGSIVMEPNVKKLKVRTEYVNGPIIVGPDVNKLKVIDQM